jgi:hypothetical protein
MFYKSVSFTLTCSGLITLRSSHSEREGEAWRALLAKGATQAPIN